jgi:hypothetical protein
MRGLTRLAATSSAVLCLTAGVPLMAQQAPATPPATSAKPNPAMNGLWDYNDVLSLDVATGQREQAPLVNGQRARSSPGGPVPGAPSSPVTGAAAGSGTPPSSIPGAAGGATGAPGGAAGAPGGVAGAPGGAGGAPGGAAGAPGGAGGTGTGGGTTVTTTGGVPPMGASGGSVDDFERSTRDMFMTERRDLVRDLLEVPELFRVRVTDEGVTFVDDLQRLRTYATNGKLQKYQLGAAQFQARAYWEDGAFHKDIEATGNFRMTEVYRVNAAGNQMSVEIRVGDQRKPGTTVGVNRVYDRVGR